MTLGDGSVPPPQERTDGGPDDIRSTEDDGVGSGDLDTGCAGGGGVDVE